MCHCETESQVRIISNPNRTVQHARKIEYIIPTMDLIPENYIFKPIHLYMFIFQKAPSPSTRLSTPRVPSTHTHLQTDSPTNRLK